MEIICNVCLGSGLDEDYTSICPHCDGQGIVAGPFKLITNNFSRNGRAFISLEEEVLKLPNLPDSEFDIQIIQKYIDFDWSIFIHRTSMELYMPRGLKIDGLSKVILYFDRFKMYTDKHKKHLIFEAKITSKRIISE